MGGRMLRLSPEIKKIRNWCRRFYAYQDSKIRIKTKHVESYEVLSPDQGSTPCSSTKFLKAFRDNSLKAFILFYLYQEQTESQWDLPTTTYSKN